MKPTYGTIYSPDIIDLESYQPKQKTFGFLLIVLAGESKELATESFEFFVCSPAWFQSNQNKEDVVIGHQHLIMSDYNYEKLLSTLDFIRSKCEGNTWHTCATKLSRYGRWEFEGQLS